MLFGSAPVLAAAALVVLASRVRTTRDDALAWVSAGVAVALLAMVLQVIALPFVAADGGLFGTTGEDGLVEDHHSALDEGMPMLLEPAPALALAHGGDMEGFCDALVALAGAQDRPDDVTLLAVRLADPGTGGVAAAAV